MCGGLAAETTNARLLHTGLQQRMIEQECLLRVVMTRQNHAADGLADGPPQMLGNILFSCSRAPNLLMQAQSQVESHVTDYMLLNRTMR